MVRDVQNMASRATSAVLTALASHKGDADVAVRALNCLRDIGSRDPRPRMDHMTTVVAAVEPLLHSSMVVQYAAAYVYCVALVGGSEVRARSTFSSAIV